MRSCLLYLLAFSLTAFGHFIWKEVIIGNINDHNLRVNIKIDTDKIKREQFALHHIVSQTVDFRFKTKKMRSTKFTFNKFNGFVLTGIREIEVDKVKYYAFDFYRSNGSPEIVIYYNLNGQKLGKGEYLKTKSMFQLYSKNIDTTFFQKAETIKQVDLMYLY